MEESTKGLLELLEEVHVKSDPQDRRLTTLYERHGFRVVVDESGSMEPSLEELVQEIRLDGSNTFASLIRGWEGVEYIEIVQDVAERMGVDVGEGGDPVEELEKLILGKFFGEYLKNVDENELESIARIFEEETGTNSDFKEKVGAKMWAEDDMATLITLIGAVAVADLVKKIIQRILERSTTGLVARGGAGVASYAVPLLNIAMVGWAIYEVTGPAFRKTVPTVVEVALMRLEFGEELGE